MGRHHLCAWAACVFVTMIAGAASRPLGSPGTVSMTEAATKDPLPLPSAMGKFDVDTVSFYVGGFIAGGNQDAYLVYPTNYDNATNASFPLVVFAHGCCKNTVNQSASDYNSVFVHLASHGMVVASYNTCLGECNMITFSDDQLYLVSTLRERPSLHPVLNMVDFSKVGLFGHSMGGGSTVFSAANISSLEGVTVKVAVAIDPAPSVAAGLIKVPTFFGCGQNDTIVPCWSVKAMYGAAPKSAGQHTYSVLRDAGHCAIQDPLPGSPWDYYIVQHMLCHMYDDASACDEIYGTSQSSLCSAGYMTDCEFKSKE